MPPRQGEPVAAISETDCQAALDQYGERLAAIAGVTGVGIGSAPGGSINTACYLVVYTLQRSVEGIPKFVSIVNAQGKSLAVPVITEVQGEVKPE
jgi:hypothetical protein